jgi:cytochrome bd-type quinol oxidase subunit 2
MTDFFIFVYAMLTLFVLQAMGRNHRAQRPNPQMMTMVGWGLFSLSSTLAILLGAVALALALGLHMPLPDDLSTSLF